MYRGRRAPENLLDLAEVSSTWPKQFLTLSSRVPLPLSRETNEGSRLLSCDGFSNVCQRNVAAQPHRGLCANTYSRCSSSLACSRSPGDLDDQSDLVRARQQSGTRYQRKDSYEHSIRQGTAPNSIQPKVKHDDQSHSIDSLLLDNQCRRRSKHSWQFGFAEQRTVA
jgi:hypothetical protein